MNISFIEYNECQDRLFKLSAVEELEYFITYFDSSTICCWLWVYANYYISNHEKTIFVDFMF